MNYVITTYCEQAHQLNSDLAVDVSNVHDLVDRIKNIVGGYEQRYDAKVTLVSVTELL